MADESYAWARMDGESASAYASFRTYLYLGVDRTLEAAAREHSVRVAEFAKLSARFDWVRRVKAYDRYAETAASDGLVHALSQESDENLALLRKLRAHLSSRLDRFMETDTDPTVRWNQAAMALFRGQEIVMKLREDPKTSERVERIEGLLQRLVSEDA